MYVVLTTLYPGTPASRTGWASGDGHPVAARRHDRRARPRRGFVWVVRRSSGAGPPGGSTSRPDRRALGTGREAAGEVAPIGRRGRDVRPDEPAARPRRSPATARPRCSPAPSRRRRRPRATGSTPAGADAPEAWRPAAVRERRSVGLRSSSRSARATLPGRPLGGPRRRARRPLRPARPVAPRRPRRRRRSACGPSGSPSRTGCTSTRSITRGRRRSSSRTGATAMPHDIYEYTHPHLAKYAMAVGLVALGRRPGHRAPASSGVPVRRRRRSSRAGRPVAAGRSRRRPRSTSRPARAPRLRPRTRALVATSRSRAPPALALDPDGHRLFVGTDDGEILALDTTALDASRARRAGRSPTARSRRRSARSAAPITPDRSLTDDGTGLAAAHVRRRARHARPGHRRRARHGRGSTA